MSDAKKKAATGDQSPALRRLAGSEVFVGYNEPNTRGLLQDMQSATMKLQNYTLTPDEVEIVYLAIARLHDLEDFGYRRDWEGITAYCPRLDDPQNKLLEESHEFPDKE